MRKSAQLLIRMIALLMASKAVVAAEPVLPDPATMREIKAYCLDFNWQGSGRKRKSPIPAS